MAHRMTRDRSMAALVALVILAGFGWFALAGSTPTDAADRHSATEAEKLAILWTSGDPDVAHRMTLMYANGAARQGWFDEVRLIIWGPSQRLVIGDGDIREKIAELKEIGVHVQACLACADSYGIADDLRGHGIEVKYMGRPLSEHLKSGDWQVLTF